MRARARAERVMLCYVMLCYDEYTNTNMNTNMNMTRMMRMRKNYRYTKMIDKRSFAKDGVQLNYIAPMLEFTIKNERFERWSVGRGAWSL